MQSQIRQSDMNQGTENGKEREMMKDEDEEDYVHDNPSSPYMEDEFEKDETSMNDDMDLDEFDSEDGEDYYYSEEDDYDLDPHAFKEVQKQQKIYKVIDPESMINEQQSKIFSVAETLVMSVGEAGTLLQYYQWDTEKLYNVIFDNKEEVCRKAGVSLKKKPYMIMSEEEERKTPRTPQKTTQHATSPIKYETTITTTTGTGTEEEEDSTMLAECQSCYDDVEKTQMIAMPCQHYMCKNCWTRYLGYAIDDGRTCTVKECPMPNCNMIVSEALFKAVVPKAKYDRYRLFQARSFVDDNPKIKWCPAPDCGKAVYCEKVSQSVTCSCGTRFCFKCQELDHAPCSCKHLVQWRNKERDDSETGHWIVANTKTCPRCQRQIEKDGGCNHMTCSQCRFEFCWICKDPWESHNAKTGGFYSCNRFNEEELEKKLESQKVSESRKAIEKYMHYYQRYSVHRDSAKFEQRLKKKAAAKMKEMHELKQESWESIEFINEGVNQLIECRSVLKYTYIHAFFLHNRQEKDLFEFLQAQLEHVTERLSELLEASIDTYDRRKIIDTTQSARHQRVKLLEACVDGLVVKQ